MDRLAEERHHLPAGVRSAGGVQSVARQRDDRPSPGLAACVGSADRFPADGPRRGDPATALHAERVSRGRPSARSTTTSSPTRSRGASRSCTSTAIRSIRTPCIDTRTTWRSRRPGRPRSSRPARRVRYIDQYGEWYLKAASTEAVEGEDDLYYDGAQTDVAIEKARRVGGRATAVLLRDRLLPAAPAVQRSSEVLGPVRSARPYRWPTTRRCPRTGLRWRSTTCGSCGATPTSGDVPHPFDGGCVSGRRPPAEARLLRVGELRGRAGRPACSTPWTRLGIADNTRRPVGRSRLEAGRAPQLGEDDELRDRYARSAHRASA